MKSALKMSAIFFVCILLFNSCNKKKDNFNPKEPTFSPTNGNAVSKFVTVKGAVRKTGSPPAPTGTVNSPELLDDNNTQIPALNGRSIFITPYVFTPIIGAYVKIQGADDYFDVPLTNGLKKAFKTTSKVSKISVGEEGSIEIELPANITPGTFCMDYCVYDSAFNISNIITVCVTVSTIGGNNSEFLMGDWKIVKEVYDGQEFYYNQQQTQVIDSISIYCSNTLSYDYYSANLTTNYEYADFTFTSNGALEYKGSYSFTFVDYDNSNCGITYMTTPDTYKLGGGWSFDDATDKLVMLFDITEYGDTEPFAYEFVIKSYSGNNLVLEWQAFDNYELHLQKK